MASLRVFRRHRLVSGACPAVGLWTFSEDNLCGGECTWGELSGPAAHESMRGDDPVKQRVQLPGGFAKHQEAIYAEFERPGIVKETI